MAQKLKDDLKTRIFKEANNEILEKGFENASIRNIAKKCNISVGNIYRYYDNKEHLFKSTYGEFLTELNNLLMMYTRNRIAVFTKFHINRLFDVNELIDELVTNLVLLISNNKEAALLLFINKMEINNLLLWFSNILKELNKHRHDTIYYEMCANGLINAISYCLINAKTQEEMNKNISLYLKTSLDIKKDK